MQGGEGAGPQPTGISGEQGTSLPNQHFPIWVVPAGLPTDLLLPHPMDGETEAQPKATGSQHPQTQLSPHAPRSAWWQDDPYLWVALAHAPDDAHSYEKDTQGTKADVDLGLFHTHDEHPRHHQEETQHNEPVAKGLLLGHGQWWVSVVEPEEERCQEALLPVAAAR